MRNSRFLPIILAIAGLGAIVIGIYQGLIHVAPGYEGTIETGWGSDLNHEEILFAQLGVVAIGGTVATLRWKRLAVVPVVIGGVVSFYVLRAVLHYARDPGLYTEVPTYGGNSVVFVLGAEPFLLGMGGLLFAVAGITGWRAHSGHSNDILPTWPSLT